MTQPVNHVGLDTQVAPTAEFTPLRIRRTWCEFPVHPARGAGVAAPYEGHGTTTTKNLCTSCAEDFLITSDYTAASSFTGMT